MKGGGDEVMGRGSEGGTGLLRSNGKEGEGTGIEFDCFQSKSCW